MNDQFLNDTSEKNADVKKEYYYAAMPTFPVQDNYGQTLINFGMSKMEYAAIALAAGWWNRPELRRDTIAEEVVNLAAEILKECDARQQELLNASPKIFDINANK